MTAEYFVVRRGRTTIPDRTVHDPRISIPALGLLTVMLGLPPKAPMGYRAFLGRGLGEKAIRNLLRELEAARYRWRFQIRTAGQLRTVTLIFEEPASVDMAWEAAGELASGPVERCLNEHALQDSADDAQSGHKTLSYRAAPVAARYDKGEYDGVGESDQDEMPSRTAQHSSAARSSAARCAVARSSAAQPSKDGSSGWVTDVTQPDQTQPPREPSSEPKTSVKGAGRAGLGLAGLLAADPDTVGEDDWTVLVECLPASMRHVEASAVPKIAAALRRRVEAGWTSEALRATLASNALPAEVRNLAGIVCHRIGQIPVAPPKRRRSRALTATSAAPTRPAEQPLAIRMRAKARAAGSPDASQPLAWWFERYPGAVSA